MKTIYKYPLELEGYQSINMPANAEILDIQMQGEVLVMWALVDPNGEKEKRSFYISGTGWPVDSRIPKKDYIATVQDGDLVWHIFEKVWS